MADYDGAYFNNRYALVNVDLGELRSTSGRLMDIADRLATIRTGVLSHGASAQGSSSIIGPSSGECLQSLYSACDALGSAVTGLRELATSVDQTARSYADKEGTARGAFGGLEAALETVVPMIPGLFGFLLAANPSLNTEYTRRMAMTGQSDDVRALTQVLADFLGGVNGAQDKERRMYVTSQQSTMPPEIPTSSSLLGGSLRNVRTAYGTEKPACEATAFQARRDQIPQSSVIVDTVRLKNGTRVVSVYIPGMQTLEVNSPRTSNDGYGAIQGVAQSNNAGRYLTQTQVTVTQALKAEGVTEEDQVVLTGHSLGGVNAVALAGDKTFTDKYTVRAVTTAGSPIAHAVGKVPAGTSVLAMRNMQDYVPPLAGPMPAVGPNVTTVDTPDITPGSKDDAHQLSNYIPAADSLDEAKDPALRRHAAVLADVYNPDNFAVDGERRIIATRTVYTAHELDAPEKPAVAPPSSQHVSPAR